MNRQQMRAELAFILGVREGEADQDFQTTRLNTALDQAYERVVLDGRAHGMQVHFLLTEALTWPSGATTLRVPDALNMKQLIEVLDMTNGEPGETLEEGQDFYWLDRETLRWGLGTAGPDSDLTLRVMYEASAEPLLTDLSKPRLVPSEHCAYIIWEAACALRGIADDGIPSYWQLKHEQARFSYLKHVSRPRPTSALALSTSTLWEDEY